MKVTLEMTEKHYQVITAALDLYSRLHMGQLDEILALRIYPSSERDFLEKNLMAVKSRLFGLSSSQYLSIASPSLPDMAKVAYEIKKSLDHDVSWFKKPSGGHTVNFDRPLKISKEPLPKVEVL